MTADTPQMPTLVEGLTAQVDSLVGKLDEFEQRRQMDRRLWMIGIAITLVLGLLSVVMVAGLVILAAGNRDTLTLGGDVLEEVQDQEIENARQVLEHRVANQENHDEAERYHRCMLRFVVAITDPRRDRTKPPTLPIGCENTVAEDEVAEIEPSPPAAQ